jgi:superfamily II DNA or RNA helicase
MSVILLKDCFNSGPLVELRPYQLEIIKQVLTEFDRGFNKILIVSPTASGKTNLYLSILQELKAVTTLIVVSTTALKDQIIEILNKHKLTTVAVETIQSIIASSYTGNIDLLVIEEAHHIEATTWSTIFELIHAKHTIGVTATPIRMDKQSLLEQYNGHFDQVVIGPTIEELTQNGYLSKINYLTVPLIQTSKLKELRTSLGSLLGHLKLVSTFPMNMTSSLVEIINTYCLDRHTLIFCNNINHTEQQAQLLRDNHISCLAYNSKTSSKTRISYLESFIKGKVKHLTLCNMLGEGIDLPQIKNIVLLKKVHSVSTFMQEIGRCIRLYNEEEATVIDLVGNLYTHGRIEDIDKIIRLPLAENVTIL